MRKFIQFEIWRDCNVNCLFCTGKGSQTVNRKNNIQYIMNELNNNDIINYQEIGIIGGEIFDTQLDNPEVSDLFYQLMDKITSMHFEKIYIATSLIFDMDRHFNKFLQYIKDKDIVDKVLICTSFDLKYRFHTKDKLQLWESNMELLHNNNTHITIILTQFFIDAVLSGEFNILDFQNRFNTRVDYVAPLTGLAYTTKTEMTKAMPDFFPTKSSFIKLLVEYGIRKQHIDLSCLLSMELRSSKLYYLDDNVFKIMDDRREGIKLCEYDNRPLFEMGFIDSELPMNEVVKQIKHIME